MNQLKNIAGITGGLEEVTNILLKKYTVEILKCPEDKFQYIGISSLNDIKFLRESNRQTYTFWAGTSGTNFNALDAWGGNIMLSNWNKNEKITIL